MKKLTVKDILECKGVRKLSEVYTHNPLEAEACELAGIEMIVSSEVNDIEGMGENEISSNVVGEAVMRALYVIDKVAYVRFASVYRDFRETKDFEQFLDTLDK